jgi:hypothetical protein
MIRCAHCKDRHETVAQVRLCSQVKVGAVVTASTPKPAVDPVDYFRAGFPGSVIDDTRVTEAGMYRDPFNGNIYKVQKSPNSGYLYAKQVYVYDGGRVEFVYRAGRLRLLKAAWRMTLDEAKTFGAMYGTCCVCGRTLTDEKSIKAGIGPICAGNL